MVKRVFISYKHQNVERNEWVEKLYSDLRKSGIDAKLDKFEVAPGESFSDYMTREIRECDYVLFVVTPKAVKAVESGRGALAFEIEISNARRLADKGNFRIIPIFREGKTTSTYLSDHRYLDFRNDHNYQKNLDILVQWLTDQVRPPDLISLDDNKIISMLIKVASLSNVKLDRNAVSHSTPVKGKIDNLVAYWNPSYILNSTELIKSLQTKFLQIAKSKLTNHVIYPLSVSGYAFLLGITKELSDIGTVILEYKPTEDYPIFSTPDAESQLVTFSRFRLTGKIEKITDDQIIPFDLVLTIDNLPREIAINMNYRGKSVVSIMPHIWAILFDDTNVQAPWYDDYSKNKEKILSKITYLYKASDFICEDILPLVDENNDD